MRTGREQSISRLGAAVACALVFAAGAPDLAGADTATPTLRAVGNGVAFVTPDAATVTIAVTRTGASPGSARARDNQRLAAILAGLRSAGVPVADVQTTQISLERHGSSAPVGGRRRHFIWLASTTLTVDTRHIDLLSQIFAAASRGGADSVDGPNYRLSDPASGRLSAEAAAVRDARRRADSAAAAAGVRVIGVQSIDLDPSSTGPGAPGTTSASPRGRGPARAPIPTPTLPGKQEVDATVDVVFLIGA